MDDIVREFLVKAFMQIHPEDPEADIREWTKDHNIIQWTESKKEIALELMAARIREQAEELEAFRSLTEFATKILESQQRMREREEAHPLSPPPATAQEKDSDV